MNYYVYKITDPKTGQFYIGSRACKCRVEEDDYMGSYCRWSPENEDRLVKEIIKSDFKSRQEAFDYEDVLIEKYWNDPLSENYHRPNSGFNFSGLTHTKESLKKISGENNGMYGKCYWSGKNRPAHSNKMKGAGNPNFGRLSIEHKNNISKAKKGKFKGSKNPASKKVIYIEDEIIFDTMKDAAEWYGCSVSNITYHCKGDYKNQKFKYYVD